MIRSGRLCIRTAYVSFLPLVVLLAACSTAPKVADVKGPIRDAEKQAGLKDVSVDQDRDKGVVTLGGHVASDGEKSQAESVARSVAPGVVIADQIAVLPPGDTSTAKDINSDTDKAIEKNLDAAYLKSDIAHSDVKKIKYDVKNGVVTLKGDLRSNAERSEAQTIASSVPNVRQVVNEIGLPNMKATVSN